MHKCALRYVAFTLVCMIPQIIFISQAFPETVHDKIRPSLVFLKATAICKSGTCTGAEQASLATGVIVSEDGLLLTVYHFLTKLGDFEPQTLQMHGSIRNMVDPPSQYVQLINANPTLDLLLLKIKLDGASTTPKISLGSAQSHSDGELIYTSGFPEGQGYITGEGKIAAREGPAGSLYATSINFGYGQSGSPVYDKDARLIGIAKGSLTKLNSINYFIPIEFADPLLSQIRIREITNAMTKINEKISGNLDPTVLDTRVKEIEAGIIKLRERMDWAAEIDHTSKKVTISYAKLLTGEPHPSQITVKVTPILEKQPLTPIDEMTAKIATSNPTDSGIFELGDLYSQLEKLESVYRSRMARVNFVFIPQLPNGHSLKSQNITINYK
jgi:S1-C subfamily serine protease